MNNSRLNRKFDGYYVLFVTILCIWGLVILYPFYNAVLVSVIPQATYIRTPFLFYPTKIDLSSYYYIFHWRSVLYGFRTTVLVVVLGTTYNVLLTIFTAYALNKPIPGRKLFVYFIVFTMYFSGGLIPYYLQIKSLHLINNYAVMILPTGISIMYMLIMQSYFRTIPAEMEESAKMEGAGDFTTLFKVILPLCKPMIATITLFYSVERWNEWYLGMLFIRDADMMPLQLLIRNMLQSSNEITNKIPVNVNRMIFPLGIQLAAIVVTMLPIACVYPFVQKYFVKGLTLGAVKT